MNIPYFLVARRLFNKYEFLGARSIYYLATHTGCARDNTQFKDVKYWATRACNWFELSEFLILKSSMLCYHVAFNLPVSWSESMRIVARVALLSGARTKLSAGADEGVCCIPRQNWGLTF